MDLTGEERIAAPREAVWRALNDVETLKAAIPGCEALEWRGPGQLEAALVMRFGPVKIRLFGELELSNINPPVSYTISGAGKGSIAGFVHGSTDVVLAEDGNETVLTYTVRGDAGGGIAQLGARLITSSARKLADRFFANIGAAAGGI
ncbi:SRPBCC family protein [Brucella sp. IR073]|uniref:SRPBCC family protein n=1 Tax=unclassified Brucella TaxID=2632610 RepID=UPI003B98649C